MIAEAIKRNYDYVMYIDADCFIWSTKNLMHKFSEFFDGDYIIGRVPDGGVFCHRNTNNYCINPFLTFFNIKKIKQHINENAMLLVSPHSENDISNENRKSNADVLAQCKAWRDQH